MGAHAAETETERGLFRSRHTAVVLGRVSLDRWLPRHATQGGTAFAKLMPFAPHLALGRPFGTEKNGRRSGLFRAEGTVLRQPRASAAAQPPSVALGHATRT